MALVPPIALLVVFALVARTWIILHIITSIQIVSSISLDEVINGLAVVFHPCPLTNLLQLRVPVFVVMDTQRWLIVAEVAQIDRHTVCIGSLSVFPTEDVVLLRVADSPTDETQALPVMFYDALTHIPTPMLEFLIHRTVAR